MSRRRVRSKLHRTILRCAENQGWGIREVRNGYWLNAPDGKTTYAFHTHSSTPSDHRSDRNLLAALKRAGLDVPVATR